MKNYTSHFHFLLFCCFVFFGFLSISVAFANSYQKIAPGDTVTLGEFVFTDDFVPTTTPCTIGITDPLNIVVIASTTPMTANTDGWHYYNYTTAGNAPSGTWPSVMICGSAETGDLVKVDKSFIVEATSSLATTINNNTNSQISGAVSSINANTNTQILTASTSLATSIPTNVWNATTRSLTTFGTLVADVWTNTIRTLTGAGLDSGSLATFSDIQTATSSLASAITAGTETLTADIQSEWTVTLSDFGETTVNTAYKAKLQVLNYATIPTDADSLPTVVITDSAGTVQVPAGVMTKDSNGTYSFSYSIGGSAVGGVWETVVSVVINGQTIKRNDYWSLSSSPADVQIIEITDKIIPTITASVRIDNVGTSASDFYYVYCIVSSADNLCGGSDDIDSASDTAFINAGSFINLSLTLDDVPTAGTYWFKVKARALAETNWAASTEQFTATSAPTPTPTPTPTPAPGDGGGGGGGGGGGAAAIDTVPTIATGSNSEADFSGDGKVNSVDFSILLFFWKTSPPFANTYVDINKDGKVDSVDFSILLYHWKK